MAACRTGRGLGGPSEGPHRDHRVGRWLRGAAEEHLGAGDLGDGLGSAGVERIHGSVGAAPARLAVGAGGALEIEGAGAVAEAGGHPERERAVVEGGGRVEGELDHLGVARGDGVVGDRGLEMAHLPAEEGDAVAAGHDRAEDVGARVLAGGLLGGAGLGDAPAARVVDRHLDPGVGRVGGAAGEAVADALVLHHHVEDDRLPRRHGGPIRRERARPVPRVDHRRHVDASLRFRSMARARELLAVAAHGREPGVPAREAVEATRPSFAAAGARASPPRGACGRRGSPSAGASSSTRQEQSRPGGSHQAVGPSAPARSGLFVPSSRKARWQAPQSAAVRWRGGCGLLVREDALGIALARDRDVPAARVWKASRRRPRLPGCRADAARIPERAAKDRRADGGAARPSFTAVGRSARPSAIAPTWQPPQWRLATAPLGAEAVDGDAVHGVVGTT